MKMVEVIVTDRDGNIVKRITVDEDLFNEYLKRKVERGLDPFTRWGLRLFRGVFHPVPTGGANSESFTDTNGTSRTQYFKRPMAPTSATIPSLECFFNTGYCNNRLWVVVGTSNTPPTPNDYKLGAKIGEAIASIGLVEEQGTLTISGSLTFAEAKTIYEVGLEWEGVVAGYNTCGRVLVDRTVFPEGIAVGAGQTLTIVYRWIT